MPAKHGKKKKRQNGRLASHSQRSSHDDHAVSIPAGDLFSLTEGSLEATNSLGENSPVEADSGLYSSTTRGETKTIVRLNFDARHKYLGGELPPPPQDQPKGDNLCLEFKKKFPNNFSKEEVQVVSSFCREKKAEKKAVAEKEANEKAKRSSKELRLKAEGRPAPAMSKGPNGLQIIHSKPAVASLPMDPACEWAVAECQWMSMSVIQTFAEHTEWKITELISMDKNKVAILGRNGKKKTIIEAYELGAPDRSMFEKTFTWEHSDPWQFGAMLDTTRIVTGCQYELGIVNTESNRYTSVDIRRSVKGWNTKRIRALAADHYLNRIVVANDKDRILVVFDSDLNGLTYIVVQEVVDFVWSLTISRDRMYMCCGFAGRALVTNWEGKTIFQFRPPESDSTAIPAIVKLDCDGFAHVFWLVKTEDSFRAVDFYYSIAKDKYIAELRLDKKVTHMTNVSCYTMNPFKDMDGHTVVMTDEGEIFISASVSKSKGN